MLKGKLCQDDIDRLKERYTKAVRLGKHVPAHPRDDDNKADLIFLRESFAREIAEIRLDADEHGLDRNCLKWLDTIEKDACINKRMRKQIARHTADIRRRFPSNEEGRSNT